VKRGIVAFCATLVLTSGPAFAESLQDEIARLIETHPQLKGARDSVAAADEGIDSAFAAFLPSADLSADFGREITDSPGTRSDGASLDVWRESASLTISQTVFDGFGTPAALATAKIGKSIAEVALDSTQQNLLFAAISAYLDVLRNTRLLELTGNNESTIQRQLKLEDERVKRGTGIAIDVLQAKSRLQASKERRVALEGNLADATARYQQTFDSKPEVDEMSLPTLPIWLLPKTLGEAEVIARAENPALDNSNWAIDSANQRKRSAKSGFFPVIELVAALNYEQDDAGTLGTRYDGSVNLKASWAFFSGFATRADTLAAAHEYSAALNNHRLVDRNVIADLRLAWQQLATARKRVGLSQNAVNIAWEVHAARLKQLEAGEETEINVLDAEIEAVTAQINATGAEYDAQTAVYRMLLALGRLTPEVGIIAQGYPSSEPGRVADIVAD
jgi:adhesin transport system outer membrane protein